MPPAPARLAPLPYVAMHALREAVGLTVGNRRPRQRFVKPIENRRHDLGLRLGIARVSLASAPHAV